MDEDKKIEDDMHKQIDDEIKEIQSKLKDKKLSQTEIEQLETKLELKQLKKFSYTVFLKIINIFEKMVPSHDKALSTSDRIIDQLVKQTGKNEELEKLLKELKENHATIQKNYSLIHGVKFDISGFKNAFGFGSED